MPAKQVQILDRLVRYHDKGTGRALILVHAFPLSADQWLPQLRQTLPGWRMIAPDVRGFRPDPGAEPFQPAGATGATMASHAADVLALMDHLGLDRAVIAGLSMGGYIALALAKVAPDRIDGLVLADTKATADDDAGRAARDAMIALVEEKGPDAVAGLLLPKLLGVTTRRVQPELAEVIRTAIVQNTPAGIASALRAMKLREDSTPFLKDIACPVLVACGAEDVLTPPSDSEAMARLIPDAELVTLEAAGHLSNIETPAAFTGALASFLDRVA